MRRRTKWIALGLVVAMCATATVGAVSMAEEQSDPLETVSLEETVEAEAPEADVEEEEIQETEAAEEAENPEDTDAEEETEAAEENAEAETEEAEENVVEYVAIPYDTNDVWGEIAITNSDLVDTALNIRSTADEDGDIIGYLYKGAAVWVIEQGDEWTEIYSNGLTGYVQNDYILFGDDVEEIADYYSVKGVRAEWDGVTVYSSTEDLSEMGEMNTGDSYPVVDDEDEHWVEIQYNEDETGFVSADDVSFVMLFESATPKDGERLELTDEEEESTEEESETVVDEDTEEEKGSEDSEEVATSETVYDVYEEDYSSSDSGDYYEESYYVEEYSTPSYSYDSSSSSSSTYSSSSYSDSSTSSSSSSSSTVQTEAEAVEEEEVGTTISSDNAGGAYYDANTDTYYDENGVAVLSYYYDDEDEYDDEYYEDDDEYYEDDEEYYEDDDEYYEEEYYEEDYEVYESSSYVEDSYVEDYSEGVTYSSDDSTLMASLIYCEAGNQPYEGMVAVGAVVMNRVDSSSFPDTISDVVYQSGQFTPAYNGMLDSALSSGVGDIYYSAADDAMSGEDPTDGALYFNTSHGSGLKIGDHWFY